MKSILKSNKFIIVITKNLYAYYKKYFKGDIYHIPMSVDFDRFQNVSNDTKVKYFMYCGRINCAKDGVDILVQAFIKLAAVYSDVSLLIVGPSHSKKDTEIITEIIDKSGFQDRIKFLGEINRENIPELLVGALGLCLARPNSTQAEGGFPTKLGEYLASGRPVAVTDTGEISDYLIDKVSAYIATPNDVNSFYIKLKEIIEDPKANEIGLKGREVALNNFSAMKQRRRIEEIIHNYIP
jgi:glycosyltransferase involved in cell wall biosynthesis